MLHRLFTVDLTCMQQNKHEDVNSEIVLFVSVVVVVVVYWRLWKSKWQLVDGDLLSVRFRWGRQRRQRRQQHLRRTDRHSARDFQLQETLRKFHVLVTDVKGW